jgi:DNA replicative helicase MCM subunit Mcm2 (Cdc46/Mcm family)
MPWAKGNYKGRAVTAPAAHGTAARYRTGCRCDGCRRAYAAVQRDRRARVKRNECEKPESETRVDRMMRLAEHRTRLIAWQKRKAA